MNQFPMEKSPPSVSFNERCWGHLGGLCDQGQETSTGEGEEESLGDRNKVKAWEVPLQRPGLVFGGEASHPSSLTVGVLGPSVNMWTVFLGTRYLLMYIPLEEKHPGQPCLTVVLT